MDYKGAGIAVRLTVELLARFQRPSRMITSLKLGQLLFLSRTGSYVPFFLR